MVTTKQIPYTITGLAMALDTTRDVLLDYEDGKYDSKATDDPLDDKFSNTIKKAKLKAQNYIEHILVAGNNPAGAIFNLKNNYGWRDKTETDLTSKGKELPSPILGAVTPPDPKLLKTNQTEQPKLEDLIPD